MERKREPNRDWNKWATNLTFTSHKYWAKGFTIDQFNASIRNDKPLKDCFKKEI